jgi:hypothetical protein
MCKYHVPVVHYPDFLVLTYRGNRQTKSWYFKLEIFLEKSEDSWSVLQWEQWTSTVEMSPKHGGDGGNAVQKHVPVPLTDTVGAKEEIHTQLLVRLTGALIKKLPMQT